MVPLLLLLPLQHQLRHRPALLLTWQRCVHLRRAFLQQISPSLSHVYLSSLGLQATDLHCSSLPLLFERSHEGQHLTYWLDLSMNNISSDVLPCLSHNYSKYSFTSQRFLNLSHNPVALNLNLKEAIQLLPQQFYYLGMSSCGLTGRLSGSFFDRIGASLNYLNLANNSLEGQVPAHLGNLSQLLHLDLSNNNFTGVAPLKNKLSAIRTLALSNNHLGGKLSSLLSSFLNISACTFATLDVSDNFLTGLIPPWLGECNFASRLKLNNNHLEGLIPNELFANGTSNGLQVLSLSSNRLIGQIPSSFRNLNELELLDLSHNRLKGNLEEVLLYNNASANHYTKLRVLLLGYNDFTGSVPPSLNIIAPSLQLIDISNNHLTGMIPMSTLQNISAFISNPSNLALRNTSTLSVHGSETLYEEVRINMKGAELRYQYVLQALVVLDLSGNNLSGTISKGLGELSGLVALNLSRNRFSGLIPSDLGMLCKQLQALDLSFNELHGPIPASFQNLTKLEVFNVSYNPSLTGPIPQN